MAIVHSPFRRHYGLSSGPALDLGKDSLIMVNCVANSVIQVPTLLFQTDLVPDGRAEGLRSGERDNIASMIKRKK